MKGRKTLLFLALDEHSLRCLTAFLAISFLPEYRVSPMSITHSRE